MAHLPPCITARPSYMGLPQASAFMVGTVGIVDTVVVTVTATDVVDAVISRVRCHRAPTRVMERGQIADIERQARLTMVDIRDAFKQQFSSASAASENAPASPIIQDQN